LLIIDNALFDESNNIYQQKETLLTGFHPDWVSHQKKKLGFLQR
jgi:hypothetical protein